MDCVQRIHELMSQLSITDIDAEIARLEGRLDMLRAVRAVKLNMQAQTWQSAVDMDRDLGKASQEDFDASVLELDQKIAETNGEIKRCKTRTSPVNRLLPRNVMQPKTQREKIANYLYANKISRVSVIARELELPGMTVGSVLSAYARGRDFQSHGDAQWDLTRELRAAIDQEYP